MLESLSNVESLASEFIESKEMVNRDAFVKAIREALLSKRFALVLGGTSVGKTLVRSHTIRKVESGRE